MAAEGDDPDTGPDATAEPPDPRDPRRRAVLAVVRDLERHVAAAGWDGQVRLFALIRTAEAIRRDPALATRLPADVVRAAERDGEHLTAVEQEDLPAVETVEALLSAVAWPPTVDGAAVVIERVVLPSSVEQELPDDPEEATRFANEHPQRQDLRLAGAVLRDGERASAIRSRQFDSDDRVAVGPDLVPALTEALSHSFAADLPPS